MLNKNETIILILALVILLFVANFAEIYAGNLNYTTLLISALFLSITILLNVVAKKLAAEYFQSKLEIKLWNFQRYGFKREHYFKKPVPIGIILPFIATIISYGNFLWFAIFESDIQGTSARASKRHGIYRFTEITERDVSFILSAGVVANLILSVIAYLIDTSLLGRWSIYYAAFSLIPLSSLDGTKIFFGNKTLWMTLAVITLIFLSYALFLP